MPMHKMYIIHTNIPTQCYFRMYIHTIKDILTTFQKADYLLQQASNLIGFTCSYVLYACKNNYVAMNLQAYAITTCLYYRGVIKIHTYTVPVQSTPRFLQLSPCTNLSTHLLFGDPCINTNNYITLLTISHIHIHILICYFFTIYAKYAPKKFLRVFLYNYVWVRYIYSYRQNCIFIDNYAHYA